MTSPVTENEKPTGSWECLACGSICEGRELRRDPYSFGTAVWTCSNVFCGGRCVPTVASSSSEADWYNPVPQDPSLYRDCYCDDHGDCAAIYRDDAWRCVICGKPVSVAEPQEA